MNIPIARSRATIAAVAVVATVTLGGGVAIAAASSSSVVACAKKSGGALRLATKGACTSTEKKVTWGVSGPRGATGARGPAGATGPAGAAGPSAAFSATRASGPSALTSTPVVVATLSALPAGAYVINATTTVTGSASAVATDVLCTLHAEGDAANASGYVGTVAGATFTVSMPMTLTHTFSGVGAVTLACNKDLTAPAAMSETSIVATLVGSQTHVTVTG